MFICFTMIFFLLFQCNKGDDRQNAKQQVAQIFFVQHHIQPRPKHRAEQCHHARDSCRAQVDFSAPQVTDSCHECTGGGRKLVCSHRKVRGQADGQICRKCDQSAAAGDGINKSPQKRAGTHNNNLQQ